MKKWEHVNCFKYAVIEFPTCGKVFPVRLTASFANLLRHLIGRTTYQEVLKTGESDEIYFNTSNITFARTQKLASTNVKSSSSRSKNELTAIGLRFIFLFEVKLTPSRCR